MLNFLTLLLIAISLSMDTFSLSIICGVIGFEKSKIFLLSIIVGVFHFVMPFIGNILGEKIIDYISFSPNYIVGLIFFAISIEMFFEKQEVIKLDNLYSLFFFAFTVSLDSFSLGLGISKITNNCYLAYFIFSLISFIFTFIGLYFGKYLNKTIGKYSNKIGALMLLILSLFYIF